MDLQDLRTPQLMALPQRASSAELGRHKSPGCEKEKEQDTGEAVLHGDFQASIAAPEILENCRYTPSALSRVFCENVDKFFNYCQRSLPMPLDWPTCPAVESVPGKLSGAW